MSATIAAWIGGIAAVGAVVVSGYQTYLLRQTLDDQFQSNLHSRQIDACYEFISQANEVRSGIESYLRKLSGEMKFGDEVSEARYLLSYLDASTSLSSKASKLKFFAGGKTATAISSLSSADVAFFFMTESETAREPENVSSWYTQFDEALDVIRSSCRSSMTGKKLELS